MISNYQKTPQQPKQRQINTCLLRNINKNLSSTIDSHTSSPSSTMSTLTADLRTTAVAAAAANKKPVVKPSMEAVVVNSIIYSKPSFCRIAVDLGDLPVNKKPTTKLTDGSCPNNLFNSEAFYSPMGLKNAAVNIDSASCLADLAAPSSLDVGEDTQVYRMCTTINGSIHHQISNLCDNILAMTGIFGVANNEHDDDSFIEFAYRDDGDDDENDDDDDDDDDEEDCIDDEYDYYDTDLDDDNDLVDFKFEWPIEPAPKLNCDKKKKVRFNTKPTVHVMHTWSYAYRTARKGEWEMCARDRERFKLRIQRAALTIHPILQREHRQKIYENRFSNLYDNDDDNEQHQTEAVTQSVSAEIIESKKPSNNIESKNPHQKKKRRKKRFCKMGNKHYF